MGGTSNGRRETPASEDGEVVLELVEDVPLDDDEDEGLLVLVLLDDEELVLADDGELLVELLVEDVLLEEEEAELVLLEDESDDIVESLILEDNEESLDVGAARVYVEGPRTVVSPMAPLGAKVISVPPTSDTRVT